MGTILTRPPGASVAEEGGFSMEVDVQPQEHGEGGAAEDGEGSGEQVSGCLSCLPSCVADLLEAWN